MSSIECHQDLDDLLKILRMSIKMFTSLLSIYNNVSSCRQRQSKINTNWEVENYQELFCHIFSVHFEVSDLTDVKMISIVIFLLIFVIYSCKINIKRIPVYFESIVIAFNFIFRFNGEERLNSLEKIHENYPRFQHIKFAKVLLVYDPEIVKR